MVARDRAGRKAATVAAALVVALAGCETDDGGGLADEPTDEVDEVDEPTEDIDDEPADATAEGTEVTVADSAFQPATLTLAVGEELTFRNEDGIAHTATAEDETFDVSLPAGETGTATIDEPGSYPYVCSIHPTMSGELIVE